MLLQFAGNKRNDPKHGDDRPGIRVARGLGTLDAVWVLTNADDPTSVHHGAALAEALGKGRRGAVRPLLPPRVHRAMGAAVALLPRVPSGLGRVTPRQFQGARSVGAFSPDELCPSP